MTIETLHSLFLQCNKVSTDTRKVEKGDIFFALKGDNFNGNAFALEAIEKGAKYVVVDEKEYNTSSQIILVEDVLKTLQKLSTFHRDHLNIPIIALTGSNGKTTTKELINATLSQKYNTTATIGNLNNHIGVPLTLLSMNNDTEIGIVEMGANHLKEIGFLCNIAKPNYGYITNFGKAHLEGFGSIEGVIKGKTELYDYLTNNDNIIFVNAEDNKQLEHSKKAKTIAFGNDANTNDVAVNLIEAQPFVKVNYNNLEIESQLMGEYNFNNISAAICMANYFKVDDSSIKTAIESYTPTNNRSQIIKKASNKIILDAYNANPTSMRAALSNFSNLKDNNKIAFLGDMFELGNDAAEEHQSLTNFTSTLNIDRIILIGENFYLTKGNSPRIKHYKSFEELKNKFDFDNIADATLLIKGSRGMALERILDLL